MIRQVTFGFLISMMSSCCYLLRLRRRKRKSVEVGDFRKGGSLWVQISDKRGSRPRITVGARKLKWFPFRVSSLEMKLSRKSTKLRRCTRLTIIVIVVIACNVYSWYIHSRCVSKNDTDVAHYNRRRSTNFNYFWQRCCWENMLSNGENWLMSVEDIASQSSVVFETRYTAWLKKHNFGVHVHISPNSAETLVRRGGITNHGLIAYSLSNISAKN